MKKKKKTPGQGKKKHILYSSAVPVKFKPGETRPLAAFTALWLAHNQTITDRDMSLNNQSQLAISLSFPVKMVNDFRYPKKKTTHSWVCNKGHRNSMKVRQRKTNRICICFLRFTATTLIIQLLFHLTNKSRNLWTCICSALITTTSRPVCFKHGQT